MTSEKKPKAVTEDLENSEALLNTDVFCMAPWIHLHVWPQGQVSPCCWSSSHDNQVYGSLNDSTSLKEIWNSKKIKQLRLKMLQNQPAKEFCYRCYDLEKAGVSSLRQKINKDFKHLLPDIKNTEPDGTFKKFHMPYVDVRFSNLCNFKCRSCGPDLSSAWATEVDGGAIKKITSFYPKLMGELLEQIESVEEIYFAGGEPLLMDEHATLLNELINKKKTSVRLKYNTNFSKLAYKNNSFLELWKQFPHVHVGASLDGEGSRAEYIRKGTNWNQILKNRELLNKECPHVFFNIESTVSVLNAWHISDFVKNSVLSGFITPDRFFANLLQHPDYLSVQSLPEHFKGQVAEKIQEVLSWLRTLYPCNSQSSIQSFESILFFMQEKDQSHLWPKFKSEMSRLDIKREENLAMVFPELPL